MGFLEAAIGRLEIVVYWLCLQTNVHQHQVGGWNSGVTRWPKLLNFSEALLFMGLLCFCLKIYNLKDIYYSSLGELKVNIEYWNYSKPNRRWPQHNVERY